VSWLRPSRGPARARERGYQSCRCCNDGSPDLDPEPELQPTFTVPGRRPEPLWPPGSTRNPGRSKKRRTSPKSSSSVLPFGARSQGRPIRDSTATWRTRDISRENRQTIDRPDATLHLAQPGLRASNETRKRSLNDPASASICRDPLTDGTNWHDSRIPHRGSSMHQAIGGPPEVFWPSADVQHCEGRPRGGGRMAELTGQAFAARL